jgi:hypothetical protein
VEHSFNIHTCNIKELIMERVSRNEEDLGREWLSQFYGNVRAAVKTQKIPTKADGYRILARKRCD